MNTLYLEFFKAFSLMLAQTQTTSLEESRVVSTEFFTQNIVKKYVYKVFAEEIVGKDENLIPLQIY